MTTLYQRLLARTARRRPFGRLYVDPYVALDCSTLSPVQPPRRHT